MKNRLLNAMLIGSIIHLTPVAVSGEGTRWNRINPKGAGFSVEVPGEPQPNTELGEYAYSSGLWFLSVRFQAVEPAIRQLVDRGDRKAIIRCLETIRDGAAEAVSGMRRTSSSSDTIDGYPAVRFSIETPELEGTNVLVLTKEHLYLVMAIGPKGSPKTDAKRFLKSFRLVATNPVPAAEPDASNGSTNLVAALAGPMLTVARLVAEERLNPLIDQVVQDVPAAARLGDRWNPSNAAWQRARTSITGRIERIADDYEKSGEVVRTLASEWEQLTPESQVAFAAALNGPAGPAILRQLAKSLFVSMIMADDPNGPKPGDRAYRERMRALRTAFDQRVGSAMAPDDAKHAAAIEEFFSRSSSDVSRLCFVVAKVTSQLEGVINLKLGDDSEAIQREIETVVAGEVQLQKGN